MEEFFIETLRYPKGVGLFLITIFYFVWLIKVSLDKKKLNHLGLSYVVFAFWTLVWVILNAYLETFWMVKVLGENVAYWSFIFAGMAYSFSITSALYLSFIVNPYLKKIPIWGYMVIGLLILQNFILNLVPGWSILRVYIEEDGMSWAEFNPIGEPMFYLFALLGIFVTFFNFVTGSFALYNKSKIASRKFIYMAFGIFLMHGSALLFHMIIPFLYENYDYAWTPPALSILTIFIVGHSFLSNRFPSINSIIRIGLKELFGIFLVVGYCIPLYVVLEKIFGLQYNFLILSFCLIFGIGIHRLSERFTNSDLFMSLFGNNDAEYFCKKVRSFQKNEILYSGKKDLEKDLKYLFEDKLGIEFIEFIYCSHSKKMIYYKNLRNYLKSSEEIIVMKEIEYQSIRDKKLKKIMEELKFGGEIFLPLRHPSGNILGLVILGEKKTGEIYYLKELDDLKQFNTFLNLEFTHALYSENLNDEVKKKTEALNRKNKQLKSSYKELQKMDGVKDEFLSIASHELRTPLSIIKGYTDFLLKKKYGDLNIQQEEFLNKIFSSSNSLLDLINKMLDISHLESGKIEFKPEVINIVPYLNHIKQGFSVLYKEKNIKFKVENPENLKPKIFVDSEQLHIVFNNLLGNAYKFTPKNGSVIISIHSKSKKFLEISVEDNGIGIPKEKYEYVFKKFQQVENSLQKEYTGSGLGLNITEKIVEKFGGKIFVESRKNKQKGIRFVFTLPLKQENLRKNNILKNDK